MTKRILKNGPCPECGARCNSPGYWSCGSSTDFKGKIVRTLRCKHYQNCGMAALVDNAEELSLKTAAFCNKIAEESETGESIEQIMALFSERAIKVIKEQMNVTQRKMHTN